MLIQKYARSKAQNYNGHIHTQTNFLSQSAGSKLALDQWHVSTRARGPLPCLIAGGKNTWQFEHRHSQCTLSNSTSTWFAAACHPLFQSNDIYSVNTASNNGRWHQHCSLHTKSASTIYETVNKLFQDFVQSTHGTLIESKVHTCRDLLSRSNVSLDHIMTWNLTGMNTAIMQNSGSTVHWVGAECNDHVMISYTVGGDLFMCWNLKGKAQDSGGQGSLVKINPKQQPRI